MMKTTHWQRCVVMTAVIGLSGFWSSNKLDAWQDQKVAVPAVKAASVRTNGLPRRVQPKAEVPIDSVLEPFVLDAMGSDTAKATAAVTDLRKHGARALKYVIARTNYEEMPRWEKLADAVAQQRDSFYSGLFWHTDLATAEAVAKRENKPILSLRLLGKLTDDLSCANSRFFRTTLYPNESVQSVLAERYVLHWESVRAVPIITIDFGDGRSIKRTITGNSLHLVLDARGRTVDVVPGLYGAGFFARVLRQSESLAKRAGDLDDDAFKSEVAKLHRDQLNEQQTRWNDDWKQLSPNSIPVLGNELDEAGWSKLAQRYVDEVALDHTAVAAIGRKQPAEVAAKLAMMKSIAETPSMKLARNLIPVIRQDSVQNEYKLHHQIHQWLANGELQSTQALTARIYDQLFLSPLNDPWYGLSKPDVYSAVENDGRHYAITATQNAGH